MNPRFFVPMAFALALAQPEQQKPAKPALPAAQPAADSQLYRNPAFGFRYRIPDGWVDRTKDRRAAWDLVSHVGRM